MTFIDELKNRRRIKLDQNKTITFPNLTLYRYESISCENPSVSIERLKQMLDGSMYFNNYKDLLDNDPNDLSFPTTLAFDSIMDRTLETIYEIIRSTFLVKCFTTTCENSFMWENYSDDYAGYCVEYSFSFSDPLTLSRLFPVSYSPRVDISKQLFDYAKEVSPMNSLLRFIDNRQEDPQNPLLTYPELIMFHLYSKINEDKYIIEDEWRFVITTDDDLENTHGVISGIKYQVKSIIVGNEIEYSNFYHIFKLCSDRKIGFFFRSNSSGGVKYR